MVAKEDQEVFDCPHCGVRSLHNLVEQLKFVPGAGGAVVYSHIEHVGGNVYERFYRHLIYRCVNCKKDTYLLVRTGAGYLLRNGERVAHAADEPARMEHQFPIPTPTKHAAVPEPVRGATIEAEKCLGVGAWNACATMVRRALEAMCLDKGTTGADLHGKLQDLRDRHVITPDLWQWADDLRVLGRSGAHAEWEDVKPEDADYGVRFLREILRYVYINPSERDSQRLREGLKKRPKTLTEEAAPAVDEPPKEKT